MTKRFPLVLFGLGSSLLPLISPTSGQERAPNPPSSPGEPIKAGTPPPPAVPLLPTLAPPSGPSLDQTIAQLGKVDEELAQKVEALQELINREAKAKRVTEPVAQSLRWSLRNALNMSGSDFNTIVAYSRLPLENETLMEQLKALEADWMAAQARRSVLLKTAGDAARASLTYVTRTATTPAEISPLVASLDRLVDMLHLRSTSPGTNSTLSAATINSASNFLRALWRLVKVPSDAAPHTVSSALNELSSSSTSIRSMLAQEEVDQRIRQVAAPFHKAQDEAESALGALLRAGKSSSEIAAALAKLEVAAEACQEMRSGASRRGARDFGSTLEFYRRLSGAVKALEAAEYAEARELLKNAESSRHLALGAEAAASYAAQFTEWEKAVEEGSRKAAEKRRADIQARLAAIKQPADLAAFGAELAALERQNRNERDADFPRGLASQLNGLAAAWESGNPSLFSRQNYQDSAASFASEVTTLRRRVERLVLTRALQMPELDEAPLADLPIEVAFDRQIGEFAKKQEWRRLLEVLETRSLLARSDGAMPRESDLATAVRAFLAGQNFELAEQWMDAVLSYKTVLRSASGHAPIQQAADRLKALNKAHPEAFTSPSVRGSAIP